MSHHGGYRPVRNNQRGIRGHLGLEAKQVYVPLTLSAQVRSAAWRLGISQQDWMVAALEEKLEREGVPVD
jgi:hypothetical protein